MQTKKDVRQVVRDFYRDQQEEEARDKALELGVPFFDLRFLEPEKDAMSYITKEESEKAGAIPIKIKNRALTIGFIDPQTKEAEKLAESLTKNYPIKGVVSAIISRPSFSEQTELFAGITKKKTIHEQDDTISIEDHGEITLQNLESEIQNAPLQEMLTKLIFVAVRAEASDIHIEPEETRARIRLRLDGVLFPIGYIDKERYKYLLSQLQLTSKLKLNSKNPQNGRFEIAIDKKDLNIRIETMPTLYGEDVVMRIFNKQATALDISELGIMKYHKSILDKTIARPHGMILVVGPTGAGKTSTSYAILNKINSSKVKVITIEDPIEYTLKGATQTQINEGDTFADRLKAVLREDPDIVMVGEIRDIAT
ncbi:MAG: ATPase, T2SS/T4P/T4SS family, partial [Bacteriovoracaceae bacterium]